VSLRASSGVALSVSSCEVESVRLSAAGTDGARHRLDECALSSASGGEAAADEGVAGGDARARRAGLPGGGLAPVSLVGAGDGWWLPHAGLSVETRRPPVLRPLARLSDEPRRALEPLLRARTPLAERGRGGGIGAGGGWRAAGRAGGGRSCARTRAARSGSSG